MTEHALSLAGTALIWGGYILVFIMLARKGRGHDAVLSGKVGFGIQALAYVATYISSVALVGFGGLAHAYGLQMLLVAAGNVWLGTWLVYRYLAWPTRQLRESLGARSPAQLIGLGHNSPSLSRALAAVFALFLGVYASAMLKGGALLLAQILPGIPLWILIWLCALLVGLCVYIGGLRGVLYTEAMQGVIMLIGILMIASAVLFKIGGPLQGMAALADLAPTPLADNGFTALSGGSNGLFILSLVAITSIGIWAQPQMIQRHFALTSPWQLSRSTPLAMLILTVLVGGAYFICALSRLILPETANPDEVLPTLVRMLLPEAGVHIFVLAIVSASLSTATALFHIAATAVAEDVPARKSTPLSWLCGVALCVLVSAGCAQIEGQLIVRLCTISWSIIASTALIPYVALIRLGKRHAGAAWGSASLGFLSCLTWYLIPPVFGQAGNIPPFFVGLACSLLGWMLGYFAPRAEGKA